MNEVVRYFPLGDAALTVELGAVISPELNRRAIALSRGLESNPFPGFIESVPAYSSVSVFYELSTVRDAFRDFSTAFDAVKACVHDLMEKIGPHATSEQRIIDIPVHFGGDDGPDLEYVAQSSSMTAAAVIATFVAQIYRVYMLGFLPGFTYMGMVNESIATPRRDAPRTKVAKGSVGIAGRQTGVYSLDSPGGWQIIGRTDLELFTPNGERPTLLEAGDHVRFVAVG